MSDESTETESRPLRQVDRALLAEANLYGVMYSAYVEMTPRERASKKQSWARKILAEAKRRNIDADEFLAMSEDQREDARAMYPERVTQKEKKPTPPRAPSPPVADVLDEDLSHPELEEEEEVHSSASAVPATEADPRMRTRPTLGDVRPSDSNEDLVGWSQPKNLQDVYSRYTIGDGQHFIRVERLEPKVWQQIPCSGYIGNLSDPISEDQFNAAYGGRLYLLQVYGPDPKGRRDAMTGLAVIKAKTEPFRYTVPVLPPNLAMLPGRSPTKQEPRMNPFASIFPQPTQPTTQADANMYKTTIDFFSTVLNSKQSNGAENTTALTMMKETAKDAMTETRRAADERTKALEGLVSELRVELKAQNEKLEEERRREPQGGTLKDAGDFIKAVAPAQNVEGQLLRQQQSHAEEIRRITENHQQAIETLRNRNAEELARIKDRGEETERNAKARVEEAERRSQQRIDDTERRLRERENEMRLEYDRVRREEKEGADRRVQERDKQHEDRIKDLAAANAREIRMLEAQHTTRTESQKGTQEQQISSLKEKIERLEEELEEAKEEARTAGDPVSVMKKATETAEAMGFKKEDENAPQTAGERFAAMAGAGLGRALETIDQWGPKMVQSLGQRQPLGGPPSAAPQQRQMPAGAQRPPQQAPQPPRRRAVAWASAGSVPLSEPRATIPSDPNPQTQPEPSQQPPMEVQLDPGAPPAPPPAPVQTAAPAPAQEPAPQQAPLAATNHMNQIFPDEVIVQFKAEVERGIDGALSADLFASRFLSLYPEPARRMIEIYKPEDLFKQVQSMPNGATSPILRRDGRRWVEKMWEELATRSRAPAPPEATEQAQA